MLLLTSLTSFFFYTKVISLLDIIEHRNLHINYVLQIYYLFLMHNLKFSKVTASP